VSTLLKLGTGEEIPDPSPEQVERALRSLRGGDGSVAILQRSDAVFMQVAGGGDEGFEVLEYSQGVPELHFQCLDGLETERVVQAFLKYREGRNDHEREFRWKPLKRTIFPGFDKVIKFATLAIIAGLVWFFLRIVLR